MFILSQNHFDNFFLIEPGFFVLLSVEKRFHFYLEKSLFFP